MYRQWSSWRGYDAYGWRHTWNFEHSAIYIWCVVCNTVLIAYVCNLCRPPSVATAAPNTTDPSPPSITFHSSDVTVTAGNDAYLECFAEGSPQPIVSWTHLDASFFSFPTFFTLTSGTLVIPSVELGSGGRYECAAENANGVTHAIVTLTVLGECGMCLRGHIFQVLV